MSALSPKTKEQMGLRTFSWGALYSYTRSRELGYSTRHWGRRRLNERMGELDKYTADLRDTGDLPSKGEWLAEHHFNSAAWRVDVGCERFAKCIVGSSTVPGVRRKNPSVHDWCRHIQTLPGVETKWLDSWKFVRLSESNVLKHRNPDALTGKRMSARDLEKAIRHLVSAVELVCP